MDRRTEDILESITDEFTAVDREWRYTYINERALDIIRRVKGEELTREEVLGKNIWEFYPELVGTIFYQQAHRALSEQKSVSFEAYSPFSDRWVEVHLYPSEEGLSAYSRDITERKRTEEELREARGRTELVLESMAEAFLALDREWRISYLNGQTLRRFRQAKGEELTREDFLGKNLWEVFPDAVGTMVYEKYHEAMREQKVVRFDTYYPPTDAWYEGNLYPSEEGLAVYSPDITERKRTEEELETRARQQAVVAELGLTALASDDLQDLMDEAVECVARTFGVEYAKIMELLPGGEELLMRAGVGFEEGLVGRARESAGLGSQAGYTLLSEEPVIAEDFEAETRFRPPWFVHERGAVSGVSVVIQSRDGPFGVLGAFATTHRAFSEDDANFLQAVANVLATAIEREEAQERVEEGREAERSRIARDLHDEPLQELTDALVQLQQIRSLSKDNQQSLRLVRLLATLDRIGPQLRGAIYDLRLEGEHERLFPELLEALVELHRAMAPESDIAYEVHDGVLSGPLGERGRQLLRIIGEALTNARRHAAARQVRIGVGITEEKLWTEIQDDGQGFDAAEDSQETLSASGGLGIRGMKERARALGGELKIYSDVQTGTKVRFELPLKEDQQELEDEAVHVLLVDDHATIREALASSFEREAGFEVVAQAGSLSEARGMLEGIDVAVVDLGLPDGYGADLIKELREANPQAQALVLSASLDRAEIARAVERGAAGVVHKSAHLDEVVEAVRRLRAGETLMPLEEVVAMLRYASTRREEDYEARQAIETLTPREIEVLEALAEGLDSRRISDRLHISLRTERNHMASILVKLGVHSQLQALVFAVRHGVVDIP